MTPWIQVYANLPSHRKICKLRNALGMKSNYEATGLVVSLWCWAAINAPDGDLGGYSSRDISEAIGYKKAPSKLIDVLADSGFIDIHGNGGAVIHDWYEHAALLMDSNEQQKKNTRERVRRYRERRKVTSDNAADVAGCNVTCNECNAPTLPNLTLPNQNNTKASAFVTRESKAAGSFTSFWAAYPKRIAEEDAAEAWSQVATDGDTVMRIMAGLESGKKADQCREDGGRFVPKAAKFLLEGYWKAAPAAAAEGRGLDDDEHAAILRILQMGGDEDA